MRHSALLPAALLLSLTVSGCGVFRGEPDPAETRAERLRVPPDLTSAGAGDPMAIPQRAQRGLLPQSAAGVQIRKAAGATWLEAPAEPAAVWSEVRDFLREQGVPVAREDEQLALLETEWLLYPAAGPARLFAPVVQQAEDARIGDSLRIRLERGAQGELTEVHVTHRRIARDADGEWVPQPADPAMEAELLQRLMTHLGVQQQQAAQRVAEVGTEERRGRLLAPDDEPPTLLLQEGFFQSWRMIGLALDRAGFTVEDRDRSTGEYFIRYDPRADVASRERGFFATLAFWRSDEPDTLRPYVVRLRAEDRATQVTVSDEEGAPAERETAERILSLLQEQLR